LGLKIQFEVFRQIKIINNKGKSIKQVRVYLKTLDF